VYWEYIERLTCWGVVVREVGAVMDEFQLSSMLLFTAVDIFGWRFQTRYFQYMYIVCCRGKV
jgi:hypothetical protein